MMKRLYAMLWLGVLISLWCPPAAVMAQEAPVILVLGDSLSAGYGIQPGRGWVARLQKRLQREGYPYRVVNASISGETTRGALARLEGLLSTHEPEIVLIELGGNDGLRGLPLAEIRRNLSRLIAQSQQAGATVVLVQMRLPPNYGFVYTQRFEQLYVDLAKQYNITLTPFILQGIALHPELMQPDGIHPNVQAQALMLDNIWPALVPLLQASGSEQESGQCPARTMEGCEQPAPTP